MLGVAAAVTAVVSSLAIAPSATASRRPVAASHVVAVLEHKPLRLDGARIVGALDLHRLGVVAHQFVCRACTIAGPVEAEGVLFRDTLDLSGSTFVGGVHFAQARFEAPALFGSPPAQTPTTFLAPADFLLARFDDLVSFENAGFLEGATFTLARFGDDTILASASFKKQADFERAAFARRADFGQALFNTTADFRGASFGGVASFRGAIFFGVPPRARKRRARTGAKALGSPRTRDGGRLISRSTASGPASDAVASPYTATFEDATASGGFDFSSADFAGAATFHRLNSAATVTFADATLPDRRTLVFTDLAAGNLLLDVGAVRRSVEPSDERSTLALLETTAKDRGDLATANDALYARRVLISRGYSPPVRFLDVVFYRTVAGYLVRPLRPLLVLLAAAAAMTLLRTVRRRRSVAAPARRRQLRLADGGRAAATYFHDLLDTLALLGRGNSAIGASRLEVLTYRVLVVCALVGLANSNPTLRQMVDALH